MGFCSFLRWKRRHNSPTVVDGQARAGENSDYDQGCDLAVPESVMTFDRELAMLAGKVEVDAHGRVSVEEDLEDESPRINSVDERREGWLAQVIDGEEIVAGNGSAWTAGGGLNLRDLERGPGVGFWTSIWDGTQDEIPR